MPDKISDKFKLHFELDAEGNYSVYSGPDECKELWDHIGEIECTTSRSDRLDKKYKLVYTWSGNDAPLLGWEIQQLADKINELNGDLNGQC